jgi:hypothetical protein
MSPSHGLWSAHLKKDVIQLKGIIKGYTISIFMARLLSDCLPVPAGHFAAVLHSILWDLMVKIQVKVF